MVASNSSTTHPFYSCKQVSPYCPVEATTLGYYPNKGINVFMALMFGLAGAITLVLGIWKKTWSYTAFITAGCMLELAGTPPSQLSLFRGILVSLLTDMPSKS